MHRKEAGEMERPRDPVRAVSGNLLPWLHPDPGNCGQGGKALLRDFHQGSLERPGKPWDDC